MADLAYQGAGPWLTTGIKRRPSEGTDPYREDPQPFPGRHTCPRRTWSRPPEVLADLPQVPLQSQLHDVNRQGRPHPGAATLKKLIDGIEIRVRRPAAGRKDRDKFISGKNKQNAVKSMVVTDGEGRCCGAARHGLRAAPTSPTPAS
ncbi:hypothetical protein Srut_39880 [Streptomyces rutgersensis]|nr:hypothetical protein Srut_39880 [Streptomyces rutgersensis]